MRNYSWTNPGVLTLKMQTVIIQLGLLQDNYILNSSYQEWQRDWPDEARQPAVINCSGANSCKPCLGLRDKRGNCTFACYASSILGEAFYLGPEHWKGELTMRTIGIGLLGLGTVGSGVVKALGINNKSIAGKLGAELQVRRILVRDPAKQRAVKVDADLITKDFKLILADPQIDIIVDAMGGIEPARDYILQALQQGKHVVTANKEVIAKYGREIISQAQQRGLGVYFEASVGGGIPIIRTLKHCMQANQVEEIMGIINGTTNYILTKMASEGRDFASILLEAQEKGYAEPDPTNDVEGYDAAYKLAILTSLAFGTPARFEDIHFRGISGITREDMSWATELGYTIKLLAVAKDHNDGLEAGVGPCLLPLDHPLAKVNDVFNGILIKGNMVGELLLTGRGAGDLPTASAVVADIMEIARFIVAGQQVGDPCTCYREKSFVPRDKLVAPYYLRIKLTKTDAALQVSNLLVSEQLASELMVNKLQQGKSSTLIYFTEPANEEKINHVVKRLSSLQGVKEVSLLPIEGKQAKQAMAARGASV